MADFEDLAAEFVQVAGFNLDPGQVDILGAMLHQRSGKWCHPTVSVAYSSTELIAARALIGLLLLDEDVLWTAQERLPLLNAFRRLQDVLKRLDAPVRVRRANGEERIERLDTGKWLRFVCCRYSGSGRGYNADLLIADDRGNLNDLLPVMATRPNPQALLFTGARR